MIIGVDAVKMLMNSDFWKTMAGKANADAQDKKNRGVETFRILRLCLK